MRFIDVIDMHIQSIVIYNNSIVNFKKHIMESFCLLL